MQGLAGSEAKQNSCGTVNATSTPSASRPSMHDQPDLLYKDDKLHLQVCCWNKHVSVNVTW